MKQKKYKIRTDLDIEITSGDIDDIMNTGLEAGITHWCCKAEVVGEYLGKEASDQISRGGTLILHDSEDDKRYELTLEKFLKGVQLYDEIMQEITEDYEHIGTGVVDALSADIIIQYAVFGELVYS